MDPRERILQKAHELFNKYGIRRVTMDAIAAQTGMSKKTIYQVFKDKDELVDAVAAEHITENKKHCDCDKLIAKNAIHQIFLTIDMMQDMLSKLHPGIIYDLQKFHPNTFSRFCEFRDNYLYSVVEDNLIWGIQEGLYRETLNVDVLTKMRLSTMFIPFDQDIFPLTKYNLIEVENEMLEHFIYGVVTIKGHRMIAKYKQERTKKVKQ